MSSDEPEQTEEAPPTSSEPPAASPEPAPGAPAANEGVWKEDYEDVIEPSEEEKAASKPPKEKPKKKHWVAITALVVIIVFLILWTALSPKVVPSEGMTYVDSDTYASLGNYTGSRDIWSGNVTWGFSVSNTTPTAGQPFEIQVLVTKVAERPGNFFFTGLAIKITNCSLFLSDGTYIAKLSSTRDLGFGKMAIIGITLPTGVYSDFYVSMKFTEYEVMRIGYIPLENVQVQKISLETLIVA